MNLPTTYHCQATSRSSRAHLNIKRVCTYQTQPTGYPQDFGANQWRLETCWNNQDLLTWKYVFPWFPTSATSPKKGKIHWLIMPTPTKKQSLELPLFRLDDFQLPVLLVYGWCSRIWEKTLKCDCISISIHVQPSSTESYIPPSCCN